MLSCLLSGESGSFLFFEAGDKSSCSKSVLEQLPTGGEGMKFDGSRSSTSVELGEDRSDGKPEESEVLEDDTVVGDMDGVQLRTVSF